MSLIKLILTGNTLIITFFYSVGPSSFKPKRRDGYIPSLSLTLRLSVWQVDALHAIATLSVKGGDGEARSNNSKTDVVFFSFSCPRVGAETWGKFFYLSDHY